MALARALSRPFWTCHSCRTSYIRAFTSTTPAQLPRRRVRAGGLAPYRAEDLGAEPTFEAEGDESEALPAFEDEAFQQPPTFNLVMGSKLVKPSFRTDGLSNLSNKTKSQGLSIPTEFVSEEEALQAQPERASPEERRASRRAARAAEKTNTEEQPMSSLPWYLQPQHQAPLRSVFTEDTSPHFERQQLPDIPAHPPEHFSDILSHLSVEIGLDYLTILDLRALDPPPALGNNLIMLVGTARSEKHLTVAAERFVAHLRRSYKGSYPYADGLLGRNEARIKAKRKAKKARALANAGASKDSIEELDDGIATGWICVHAGYYDPHPEAPRKEVRRVNGMVGFGEESRKVTLVVQMFTEERRGAVDIEALWEGILARNLKKQEKDRMALKERVDEVDGEVAKADVDEEGLTAQEMKARKRFKMGDKTVLDDFEALAVDNVHDAKPASARAP